MSNEPDDTSVVDLSDKQGVVDPADLKKDDPPDTSGSPISSGDDDS
jgi:hypothetical protein